MSFQSSAGARPRVAIIGGGIFGVTAALILGRYFKVDLIERSASLFQGATRANHGRQHLGFHYPRSPETAQQCLESRSDFQGIYGRAEVFELPNYYGVAAEGSKVSPEQYCEFCGLAGLEYRREEPPRGVLAEGKVALSLRVDEGVIDYATLREVALERLDRERSIRVRTAHEVMAGEPGADGIKRLSIRSDGVTKWEDFHFVVNATYAHYNSFCEWFGFQPRKFQYNLQELNVIELPSGFRGGVTIMDGIFPSCIPMGRTPYHLLAHVSASQLVRESSIHSRPLLGRVASIESNWSGVLEASADYLPILRKARYVKSLFVDRVVDADASGTDARLTDLTDHGDGCFSIFSAKLITSVSTANKLAKMIVAQR